MGHPENQRRRSETKAKADPSRHGRQAPAARVPALAFAAAGRRDDTAGVMRGLRSLPFHVGS